jgi:hypothetical protein
MTMAESQPQPQSDAELAEQVRQAALLLVEIQRSWRETEISAAFRLQPRADTVLGPPTEDA